MLLTETCYKPRCATVRELMVALDSIDNSNSNQTITYLYDLIFAFNEIVPDVAYPGLKYNN